MLLVTVITSIPPFHSKREVDGDDFTGVYHNACIDSWACLGADVVSVNSVAELGNHPVGKSRYSVATVEPDGSADCGKPLVLWNDLIDAAIESSSEQIVFINSDVFIHRPSELAQLISELRPGQAIVGRRTNIKSLKNSEASIYRLGFDLFVLHRKDLSLLRYPKALYFGDPWWDYVALCNLLLAGVTVTALDSVHMLHLIHETAFSKERWASIGFEIIDHLYKSTQARGDQPKTASAMTMVGLITDCYDRIQRGTRSGGGHGISNLAGEPSEPADDSPLRKFSHGLVRHTEEVLDFKSDGLDQFSVANACSGLLEALSERQGESATSPVTSAE
jgi:hypothetical protein